MNASTTLTGLLGGSLAAALLAPLLYLDVPRTFISDWSLMSHEMGLGATLGAAVVIGLAGALAGFRTPDRPAHSGALAGLIAGAIALLTVGLPAAGVMAHGDLISSLEAGRATALELKRGIAISAVLVPFYQTVMALLLLIAGVVLGWLGGIIQDLALGTPNRFTPVIRPSPVPWLGLTTGLLAVPALLAGIVAVEHLVFDQLGGSSTWIGQAQLTSPLVMGAAIMGGCLYVIARDAILVRRAGQRGRALLWLFACFALLGVQALVAIPVYWQVLLTPAGWLAILLLVGSLLAGLVGGRLSSAAPETTPRTFGDLLGEAITASTLMVVLLALHGSSAGLLIGLISAPWVDVLLAGGTAMDTQTAAGALQSAYLAHLAYPGALLGLTMAYLMLGVPVWLVARARR